MALSNQLIKDFQQIYKEEAGIKIGFDEAKRLGTYLVEYFQILIKINEKSKTDEIKKNY